MGGAQSSVSTDKLEEWEQICAAMAFEEAQAEKEFDAQEGCLALRCYCMQQCAGKYCELPLRCCYHWSCAAMWSICSASCASCGVLLPEHLLVHHHTMLGSCAAPAPSPYRCERLLVCLRAPEWPAGAWRGPVRACGPLLFASQHASRAHRRPLTPSVARAQLRASATLPHLKPRRARDAVVRAALIESARGA